MALKVISQLLPNLETALSTNKLQLSSDIVILNALTGDVVRTTLVGTLSAMTKANTPTGIETQVISYALSQWGLTVTPAEVLVLGAPI